MNRSDEIRAATKRIGARQQPADGCPVCGTRTGGALCATHNARFIANELQARREILARFARTGPADGIVATRRAQERAEDLVWRGLQNEYLGDELRAWDRAQQSDGSVELVEEIDAARNAQALAEVLDGWGARGRAQLGFTRSEAN